MVPGGAAASFRRGRFEFEASLHEMAGVGTVETPGSVRKLFDKWGVKINWLKDDYLFRVITDEYDVVMPAGIEAFYEAMEKEVPEKDILFKDELDALVNECDKLKVVYVLSDEEKDGFEYGFISKEIIQKYAPASLCSVFICGPKSMHEYLDLELKAIPLEKKFIRYEVMNSYEGELSDTLINVTVIQSGHKETFKASTNETILQSLERNGIKTTSRCRSGECGFCHSRLIGGDVYISKKQDYRRKADELFGYIHPCVTYPLTDIIIEIPN